MGGRCELLLKGWAVDLFDSHLTPRVPQNGSKMWFNKNGCHNRISHSKLSIYAQFRLLVTFLMEMANFDNTPF